MSTVSSAFLPHILTQIKGNPYHYDNHVELIGLLRQLGDLDGARNARNAMSEVFPLTEGIIHIHRVIVQIDLGIMSVYLKEPL